MHGNVSFIELGMSDTERSRPFFQQVFGWTFTPLAQGGGCRTLSDDGPSVRFPKMSTLN
jgi:predicted enzyme related to lactoylglutathione lyase